jgi:putative ABC transport system permease protein
MLPSLREHAAHRGVFALAVLTLAFGIGGATTMYGTLTGVGNGMPTVPDEDRVGRVFASNPGLGVVRGSVTMEEYEVVRATAPAFEELAAFASGPMLLSEPAGETTVEVQRISPAFLRTLGFHVIAGRAFRSDEAGPGSAPVALVGERFCAARWGSAAAGLGRSLRLSGVDYLVIGVLPDGAWYPARGVPVWTPLGSAQPGADSRDVWIVGRLKRDAVWTQAVAELQAAGRRLAERDPAVRRGWSLTVVPQSEESMKRAGFGVFAVLGPAVVVLLIACGNVANLLLARGTRREREMAVRAALGASRARMVGERVAETAWIAAAAGAAGIVFAYWGARAARAWIDAFKPGLADGVGLSLSALAFALAVTALTPLVVGLLPALLTTRRPFTEALHESARHRSARRGPYGGRDLLVIVEMALAVVLVLTGGLLSAFFWEMNHIDRHFDSSHVLAASLDLPRAAGPTGTDRRGAALAEAVLESVRALPGVRAAAVAERSLPIGDRTVGGAVEACADSSVAASVSTVAVGPHYFDALGLPLLQGRPIDGSDGPGSPTVAVVSEWMARRCWPGASVLGRRLLLGASRVPAVVVGMAADAMTNASLGSVLPPAPVYLATAQHPSRTTGALLVRSYAEPRALVRRVREAVRAVDRQQPLAVLAPFDELLASRFAEGWLVIGLMQAFAVLALALAGVGVFSVTSYSVAERTREFGVRVALGASPGDVARLVLRRALTVVGVGAAAAGALTIAVTRVMFAELITVGTQSPLGFLAIAGVLSVVTLVACLAPVRRATRVDPVVALRTE